MKHTHLELVKHQTCQRRNCAICSLRKMVNRKLTLQKLSQIESFEQSGARAPRFPGSAPAAVVRCGGSVRASAAARYPRSDRAWRSSTMNRGSTVAGSATTRSRRQAGPPPLAIDWRTSTTSTRRIGPLPARWRSIQLHTGAVSRASVGTISVVSPPGGVTSCALNRYDRTASASGTSASDTSTYSKPGTSRSHRSSSASLSAKAFSWANSTRSLATATTSL